MPSVHKEKRTSYKTERGTLREYLVFLYPLGLDYRPESGWLPPRIHDDRRDNKGNFQTLAAGKPDLDPTFVSFLEGIPHSVFSEAIETLRAGDRGKLLIKALEWYQSERLNKAMGHTRQAEADALGVHANTLPKWRDEAVELIRDLVFRVPMNKAPTG